MLAVMPDSRTRSGNRDLMADQTVQRTGASRFAQRQIERHRRLAPVADLSVSPMKTHILCIYLFSHACLSFGQGLLYSFSGNISSLYYDGGGILAAQNVAVGDPLSVSYIVDFGAPGYYLLYNGTMEFPADPPLGNVYTEYFYCHLASGTLLPDSNGGFNNGPQDVREYFTGWNRSNPTGNQGLLWGGSGNSDFSVYKDSNLLDSNVQNWQAGTEVQGTIVAWSDKDWSIAWADMRLDSITVAPEPSVNVLLLICGGTWYLWSRRRANQSRQPTPGERLGPNRTPVARRGCAHR